MKLNKIMKLILVMIMLFALFASGFQAPVAAGETNNKATVTVVGGENQPLLEEKEILLTNQMTALDVLIEAVGEDAVDTEESQYGKFIYGILGEEATGSPENLNWSFYTNGFSASVGATSYQVQNGDSLQFVLEAYNPENSVSIKVIGENDTIISELPWPSAIHGTPTALDLLKHLVGPDNVMTTEYDFGIMIDSINGIEAGSDAFWSFLVNGEMILEAASSYVLEHGNEITFKYQTFETPPVDDTPEEDDEDSSDDSKETPSKPIESKVIQEAIDTGIAYIPTTVLGEWEMVALNQAGKAIPSNYLQKAIQIVKDKNGIFRKITDTERYALGILAAGGDPTNVAGYNLIASIYDGDVTKQGINGVAYALITLDSSNFNIPTTAKWNREKLVQYLIDHQQDDGRYVGVDSDIDLTAMVLTALAPYKNQAEVSTTINRALEFISRQYQLGKIDTSSAAAQVIIALSALGIDANNELVTNEGVTIVSHLLSFQNEDYGFGWKLGKSSEYGTTSQSVQALVAYQLFLTEKGRLFNLSLATNAPGTEHPEKTEDEKAPQSTNDSDDKIDSENEGKPLPDTATNQYTLLAIGLLIILIGGTILILKNRKK